MATIIDGKLLSANVLTEVKRGVTEMVVAHGITPGLAVVLVGDNPASDVYVRAKIRKTLDVGMMSYEHRLPHHTGEAELLSLIATLNEDAGVHGILVQLPLPPHIDAVKVLDAIDPRKDVDGFHPVNVGRLSTGTHGLVPCTPLGCMMLLDEVITDYRGLHAVVIGKSNVVGKPVSLLLLERECTVLITHIHTRNLPSLAAAADILVVAAGSPGLVRGNWVKAGAVVIDVGINRIPTADGKSRIVGDVVTSEMEHAGYVTPVPGGVGPMTIACLLSNTLKAAQGQHAATAA